MKQKTAVLVRFGAYGDCIIITPIIRYLKSQGYHITVCCSERGIPVFGLNPHIDEIKLYKHDEIPIELFASYWQDYREKNQCDLFVNFSGSVEISLAVHPDDEHLYKLNSEALIGRCNRNYYEFAFYWADLDWNGIDLTPEMFFEKSEHKAARSFINFDKFNILWSIMGSGRNKFYPWVPKIIDRLYDELPNVNVITVGGWRCNDVEDAITAPSQKLVGKCPMRISMAMCSYVDLVIASDTGLIHAAGCTSTPKICLLGHTNIENITKHFKNDYSIEADCECAPCFRLIYDMEKQCVVDPITGASACMGYGIDPNLVIERIKTVYNKSRKMRRK